MKTCPLQFPCEEMYVVWDGGFRLLLLRCDGEGCVRQECDEPARDCLVTEVR